MIITTIATFTMRAGKVPGALQLIRAVKRQAEAEQPGTLVYLVHRKLDAKGKPSRHLLFYERYRNGNALKKHLGSKSWLAIEAQWQRFFEGKSAAASIKFFGVDRIAAFERPGAIPVASRSRRRSGARR